MQWYLPGKCSLCPWFSCHFLTLFRTHLAICLGSQFAAARTDSRYVLGWFKWHKRNFSWGKGFIHLVLHCLVRNANDLRLISFTIPSSYQAWELCCVKNQIASPAFRSCWMMIPGLFPDNLSCSIPFPCPQMIFVQLHSFHNFISLAAYLFLLKISRSRCQTLKRRQLMTCYLLSATTQILRLYCRRECVAVSLQSLPVCIRLQSSGWGMRFIHADTPPPQYTLDLQYTSSIGYRQMGRPWIFKVTIC